VGDCGEPDAARRAKRGQITALDNAATAHDPEPNIRHASSASRPAKMRDGARSPPPNRPKYPPTKGSKYGGACQYGTVRPPAATSRDGGVSPRSTISASAWQAGTG